MATSDDYKPGSYTRRVEIIEDCLTQLEMVGVPKYMLDEWRYPLIRSLKVKPSRWGGRPRRCYLGFYGEAAQALVLKIGMATEPRKRLAAIDTGAAHRRLWAFQTEVGITDQALEVERALLAHFGSQRMSGEWVRVGTLDESGAVALAAELSEVGERIAGCGFRFHPILR